MTRVSMQSYVLVSVGSLLQLLLQFGLQIVLARSFGTSAAMDGFEAGWSPSLLIAAFCGGPAAFVLPTILSDHLARHGPAAVPAAAGRQLLIVACFTTVLALAVSLGAPAVVSLLYGQMESEVARDQAIAVLRLTAWIIPCNALAAMLHAMCGWNHKFLLSASVGVVGLAATVVLTLGFLPAWGILAVAGALVAGAALGVILLAIGLAPCWSLAPPAEPVLRPMLKLVSPLLAGALFLRLDPMIDRILGAQLDPGTLAHLAYSSRLSNALLALTSGSVSAVAIPVLSRAATVGRTELSVALGHAISFLSMLLVPTVAAVLLFSDDVIRDCYERGRFTAADTLKVATILNWSLGLVVGAGLAELTGRAFAALGDTRTSTAIGIIALLMGFACKGILIGPMGAAGLVCATSIAHLLGALLQLLILRRRLGPGLGTGLAPALGWSCCFTMLAAGTGAFVLNLGFWLPAVWGGIAGLVVYVAAVWLLHWQLGLPWLRARETATR